MADKSNPYATRFRQDVADQIEAYREQQEEETGVLPGRSQAIHDLAVIGVESEVGDGTPRERELARDVEHLREEVDRLKEERDERVERLKDDKADLLTYAIAGGIMVLGLVVGAFGAYAGLSDPFPTIAAFALGVGALMYAITPIMNRVSWIP